MYLCVCVQTSLGDSQIRVEGVCYLLFSKSCETYLRIAVTSLEFYWTQFTKVNVDALKS